MFTKIRDISIYGETQYFSENLNSKLRLYSIKNILNSHYFNTIAKVELFPDSKIIPVLGGASYLADKFKITHIFPLETLEDWKKIIEMGVEITQENINIIIKKNNREVFKYIDTNIIKNSFNYFSLLMSSCLDDLNNIVEYILEVYSPTKEQENKLISSLISEGKYKMGIYLIEKFKNTCDFQKYFQNSLEHYSLTLEDVKFLVEEQHCHVNHPYYVIDALCKENMDIAKYFLEKGANLTINQDNIYTLAENGTPKAFKFLIDNNYISVDIINEAIRFANNDDGWNIELVEFLLQNGADLHTKSTNFLETMIVCKNTEVLDILIHYGAKTTNLSDEILETEVDEYFLDYLISKNVFEPDVIEKLRSRIHVR